MNVGQFTVLRRETKLLVWLFATGYVNICTYISIISLHGVCNSRGRLLAER